MPEIIPFTAPALVADTAAFPENPTIRWRRELHRCRSYHDAAALAYRMIRETERAEKIAGQAARHELHQLAFPWARAE